MKKIYNIITCIFLCACTNNQSYSYNFEELLSLDVSTLEDKEYEIKLSDLMESVEIVQLDNSTEDAYTGIFKLGISDNYLVT